MGGNIDKIGGKDEILVTMNLSGRSELAEQLSKVIAHGIQLSGIDTKEPVQSIGKQLDATIKQTSDFLIETQESLFSTFNESAELINSVSQQLTDQLKEQKKIYDDIKEKADTNGLYGVGDRKKTGIYAAIETIKAFSKAGKKIFDEFKDKISEPAQRFKDLNEAGIRLTQGFDQTFWKLSNEAGVRIDEFSKILMDNSKYVNSLTQGNAFGGETTIANALSEIIGLQGTSKKQAESIIRYFNETMLESQDLRNMTSHEYTRQLIETTKHLQELSKATGLSVEQIIEKNKLDENDLVMRQLHQSDKETFETLNTLNGMTPEKLRYIMLGTMSKDIAQTMALNPNEGVLLEDLRRLKESGASADEIKDFLRNTNYKKNEISEDRLQVQAYTDQNSPLRVIGNNTLLDSVNAYGSKGEQTPEEKENLYNYGKAISLQKEADRIYNEAVQSTTIKINNLGTLAEKMEGALKVVRGFIPQTEEDSFMGKYVMPWIGPVLSSATKIAGTIYSVKALGGGIKAISGGIKAIGSGVAGAAGTLGTLGTVAAGAGAFALGGYGGYKLADFDNAAGAKKDKSAHDRQTEIMLKVQRGEATEAEIREYAELSTTAHGFFGTTLNGMINAKRWLFGGGQTWAEQEADWVKRLTELNEQKKSIKTQIPDIEDNTPSGITNTSKDPKKVEETKNAEETKKPLTPMEAIIENMNNKILTNETFVSKLNDLIDKTELMVTQLKTIASKELSLTERAVVSQSR